MQESAVPTDGRAARAARTRSAIVDATVALVEEGDLRPTAPRIAERAGVSVRSVFQHFDDLPSLHTAVVQRVLERLAVLVVPVDPGRPLEERITTFTRQRSALLEAVTPFRRAAAVHGPFAPEIRRAIAEGSAFLRSEVEQVFAPELASMEATERREVVGAVAATSSWAVWDALRAEMGHSPEQAGAVVERTLRSLLAVAPT
ncbi:MAG: TetR/AcrR family transcriptional regulator, partial [Acidimicrobiales bacterium]|nr:TetR/AcrR family transcriptional regulator [Acidimicrobiales bacterium]